MRNYTAAGKFTRCAIVSIVTQTIAYRLSPSAERRAMKTQQFPPTRGFEVGLLDAVVSEIGAKLSVLTADILALLLVINT